MRQRKTLLLLFVLGLAAVPAAVALAKKAPVDLSGTVWQASRFKERVVLKKAGAYSNVSEAWLYFGPQQSPSLTETQFLLQDEAGHSLTGTWSDPNEDGRPVLAFDPAPLDEVLAVLSIDAIQHGVYPQVNAMTTDANQVQVRCKFNGQKGKISVRVTFSASAYVNNLMTTWPTCRATFSGTLRPSL